MIVCHYDDTNDMGGLEKQATQLSEELHRRGEDIVVLGSTRAIGRTGWKTERGVPVKLFWTYASPQVSGRYLPAALLWAIQLLAWVVLNRRRIQLIHCHQIRIHAFVAAIASKFFGIPSILKSGVGGPGADIAVIGSKKYFGSAGRQFVVRNATSFVSTTESIADDLRAHGVDPEKIAVIPNGVSNVACHKSRVPDVARTRRCVFLGRLASDKNPLPLAEAAVQCHPTLDMTLDIYGKGPETGRLTAFLTEHADSGVAFRGYAEDTSEILPDYGWLILPSDAEGLSNAMIEAMFQGVVPLATQVSGCVDHIEPGVTGFFLRGVDTRSIVAGLEAIAGVDLEHWRTMSGTVKAYAARNFGMDAVGDRYIALYRQLTGLVR